MHNKLLASLNGATRAEVVANWQSVLINDYLPKILDKKTYDFLTAEVVKPNFGAFKYRPGADGVLQMPHEFALGFRMGHSMHADGHHLGALGSRLMGGRPNQFSEQLTGFETARPGEWSLFLRAPFAF